MRHPRAEIPGPGQESVWDFPRPAICVSISNRLRVEFGGRIVAETSRGMATLETSHPPTYYFPPADVDRTMLTSADRQSFCEWKGMARYFDVTAGDRHADCAAWAYPTPSTPFAAMAGHVAFYPALMEGCFVDGERVIPQPGGFYGGWITSKFSGPFKGIPGSMGW